MKYPDGNTTIGTGEDNVQLAYHTDGTLNTRKDQRGTTLLFAYDELRRPQAMQVTADGTADPTVQSITRGYDTLGRLTKTISHGDDTTASVSFNPDANGDGVQETSGGSLQDAAIAKYEYDGRNYRIEKTAGGVTLDYYYTESWQCVEVHEDGDTANPLEQYVWHPYYIDAAIVRYWDVDTNGSGIAEHYYLHHANFNVTALTDDAAAASVLERYDYTPYGVCKVLDANFADDANGVSDVENPVTFTGRTLDADTGLYHFRNRDYGAEIGRFCQRDPIGYADGLNLYAGYFVPITVDPYGEFKVKILLKMIDQGRWVQKVKYVDYDQARNMIAARVQDARRAARHRKYQGQFFVNMPSETAARQLAEETGEAAVRHPPPGAGPLPRGEPPHYHPAKGTRPNSGRYDTEGTPHIGWEYTGVTAVFIDLSPIGDIRDLGEISGLCEAITLTYEEAGRTVAINSQEGQIGTGRIEGVDTFGTLTAGSWRDVTPGEGVSVITEPDVYAPQPTPEQIRQRVSTHIEVNTLIRSCPPN